MLPKKRMQRRSALTLETLESRLALSGAEGVAAAPDPLAGAAEPTSPAEIETFANDQIDPVATTLADDAVVSDADLAAATSAVDLAATTSGGVNEMATNRAPAQNARLQRRLFNRSVPQDPTPLKAVGSSVLTRGNKVVGFTIRFSESLDVDPARDVRNYRVFEVSKPDRFLSRLLYQDEDVRLANLPILKAEYVADENSVVLLLRSPRNLRAHYRIGLANPQETHQVPGDEPALTTLRDTNGNPLSVPTNRLGIQMRGPIVITPRTRIRLERRMPGSAIA